LTGIPEVYIMENTPLPSSAGSGNFSQSFFGEKHGKGEEKRRKREKSK
jgi:hypothetical protein